MKENMKSRRGVALAEAVIALVVIGVISVATLTIIFSSVQIENKTIVAVDVRNQAENAIECFRFADGNKDTFFDCLETIATGEQCNFAENGNVCVMDMGGYEMRVTAVLKDGTAEMQAFLFEAVYENGDMIYSFTFPSGEGGATE